MKVKELIEYLQKFDGELEVYVYADHGQTATKADKPEIYFTYEELEFQIEDYYHKDDYNSEGLENKFVMV